MRVRGFSLLEVMVSLAILSFSLLGLLRLQTLSVQYVYHAYLYGIAQMQIINAADMYKLINKAFITNWEITNQQLLPAANSSIQTTATHTLVRLSWQEALEPYQLQLML